MEVTFQTLDEMIGSKVRVIWVRRSSPEPYLSIVGILEGNVERGKLRVRFNEKHYRFFNVDSIWCYRVEDGLNTVVVE